MIIKKVSFYLLVILLIFSTVAGYLYMPQRVNAAIALSNKTNATSTADPTTTASLTWTAGSRGIVAVAVAGSGSSYGSGDVSVTGGGVTWNEMSAISYGGRRGLFVFLSSGTPTSGALSIDDAGNAAHGGTFQEFQYSVDEITGFDTTSVNDAAVGSANLSATSFSTSDVGTIDTGDVVYAVFGMENASDNLQPASGSTEHVKREAGGNVRSLLVEYSTTDDTPGATWNSTGGVGAIAFVINVFNAPAQNLKNVNIRGSAIRFEGDILFSDDFNRANLGTLGTNYGVDTFGFGGVGLIVVSNEARCADNAFCDNYWSAATFGPDLSVTITLGSTLPATSGTTQLYLRVQSPGSAAADGYEVTVTKSAGTDTWQIYEILNGSESAIGSAGTTEVSSGDKIRFEANGTTLSAYHYTSGAWNHTPIVTATDGTYSAAGNVGFSTYNGGAGEPILDNFVGQSIYSDTNKVKIRGGGGSGGTKSFFDDFNRADSTNIGSNWTEEEGDFSISTNRLSMDTQGYVKTVVIYSATAASTVNQFVRATLSRDGGTPIFPEVVFRYTNSSSPFYSVQFDENNELAALQYNPDAATNGTLLGSLVDFTLNSGDVFGATIAGAGSDTVVRLWRNPIGTSPESVSSWGGDTTPDATLRNTSSSVVNTGFYVGFSGYTNAGTFFDDFYAGDVPVMGGVKFR